MSEANDGHYWLFGYGSLIWKPPPHAVERIPGYIKGKVRRFWQSSDDHRGTPDAPGRVVTLINREFWQSLDDPHPYGADDVVYGVAYKIDPQHAAEVKAYMDYREKNGYSEQSVLFHSSSDSEKWSCKVYVGLPDNPAFVGPEDPASVAAHIAERKGPSGPNYEYLFELDRAIRDLHSGADEHILDLTRRVRDIQARSPPVLSNQL